MLHPSKKLTASNSVRLLLFTKAPIPGQVKTRLIPLLGESRAAQLHRLMTSHTLSMLQASSAGDIELWCSPTVTDPFFLQLAEQYAINLHRQQGSDLGERMMNALNHALQSASMAIVIGSDCLQVTANHVSEVITQLKAGNEAVIIPAVDGGYVLLGLRQVHPALFERISWGSDKVMETTRQRLEQLQWQYCELPAQYDIDEAEDLQRMLQNVADYEVSRELTQFLESVSYDAK